MKTPFLALTLVLLAASTAAAQGRAGERGRAADRDAAARTPAEVLNMLDAYALLQAQTALQLNDEQYGKFVPRLRDLQGTRRRAQRTRNGLLADLQRLTHASVEQVDEGAVRERLRQLREHDAKTASEVQAAYEALDQVLDVRQQARFRLFEETLERRKLDLLMRARRNAAVRGQ